MKVAVYAIALNEAQFVDRWLDCVAGADFALIADTGSTDGTATRYREWRLSHQGTKWPVSEMHHISIKPWRFDLARNAALALVPADIDVCIALDMDEVLMPGWRTALERAWKPETTRLRHPFAFTENPDGTPAQVMYGHRIHGRHDYYWRYPMHEVLWPSGNRPESVAWCDDLWIHHRTAPKQHRANYLPWLRAATLEMPTDERMCFYYGRELMYGSHWAEAIKELKRYLELPSATWSEQRAEAMRYIGRCYGHLGDDGIAEAPAWFNRACLEQPNSRQCWYEWAKNRMEMRDWAGGYWAAVNAEKCDLPKGECYDTKELTAGPYDVGGVCAFYLGLKDVAAAWLTKASEMYPDDERMRKNLSFLSVTS